MHAGMIMGQVTYEHTDFWGNPWHTTCNEN